MFVSSLLLVLSGSTSLINASPFQAKQDAGQYLGVATFNNFARQGQTVCGPLAAKNPKNFGAAAGDLSRDISAGLCTISHYGDQTKGYDFNMWCVGPQPKDGYPRPNCSKVAKCDNTCYKVENLGDVAQQPPSNKVIGKPIVVQIIDSCPAGHAQNYCNSAQPDLAQRCQSHDTNSLDIDLAAYLPLAGVERTDTSTGLPNLNIRITETSCD